MAGEPSARKGHPQAKIIVPVDRERNRIADKGLAGQHRAGAFAVKSERQKIRPPRKRRLFVFDHRHRERGNFIRSAKVARAADLTLAESAVHRVGIKKGIVKPSFLENPVKGITCPFSGAIKKS